MKKSFRRCRVLLVTAALTTSLFTGCGSSDNQIVTDNLSSVSAPVTANDSFTALGNSTVNFSAANGVLTNDSPNGANITGFDATTTQGGAITLNADGSFVYTPVFGFTGTDTFTYTLDNTAGSSTATVTLTVSQQGFFVNNQAAAGGNGSQATPFTTIAQGLSAASPGDTVFVFRGDGTPYASGFAVPNGVNLVGEANGLVVAQEIVPSGQAPILTAAVTLNGENTIAGFSFDTGSRLSATNVNDLTISNNTFRDGSVNQVSLENIGGSLTANDNRFYLSNDIDGFHLDNRAVPTVTIALSDNTFELLDIGSGGDGLAEDAIQLTFRDTAGGGTATLLRNTVTGTGIGATTIEAAVFLDLRDTAVLTCTVSELEAQLLSDDGIKANLQGTSMLTVEATSNTLSNIGDDAISLNVQADTTLEASLQQNALSNVGEDGVDINAQSDTNVTATVSGNTISNVLDDGISINCQRDSRVTGTLVGNTISGTGSDGIYWNAQRDSSTTSFIRDNNLSSVVERLIYLDAQSDSNHCLDLFGNTFEGQEVNFDVSDTATLNIERFSAGTGGPLETVNTFLGGSMVTVTNIGTPIAQPAGFCTTP